MEKKETKYFVAKETYIYRFCSNCCGSGKTKRTFQGRKYEDVCRVCNGSCKEEITHRTEIPLEQALGELKINILQ